MNANLPPGLPVLRYLPEHAPQEMVNIVNPGVDLGHVEGGAASFTFTIPRQQFVNARQHEPTLIEGDGVTIRPDLARPDANDPRQAFVRGKLSFTDEPEAGAHGIENPGRTVEVSAAATIRDAGLTAKFWAALLGKTGELRAWVSVNYSLTSDPKNM